MASGGVRPPKAAKPGGEMKSSENAHIVCLNTPYLERTRFKSIGVGQLLVANSVIARSLTLCVISLNRLLIFPRP